MSSLTGQTVMRCWITVVVLAAVRLIFLVEMVIFSERLHARFLSLCLRWSVH